MRILSMLLLLFASSASAQSPPSVDCDAVKNSTVPVELAYHSHDGTKTVVQTYPDKSGDFVVWTRQTSPSSQPNPPVFVAKATHVNGLVASGELSTTYAGKYSHQTSKYAAEGLPRNFDRRSDLTYKMHAVTTDGNGSTEEKTSTVSHKFKSEGTTAVGSCALQVIHAEVETTNDAARTRHSFQLYFPELRIFAWAVDAEPILDSLNTVFSEIKPLN